MADYQGKKVVIIGLGMTGLSCVDFFMARGVTPRVMDTRVAPAGLDKLPEAVERYVGGLNEDWLLTADLIVASPGIAQAHPSLSAAADAGVEIVGDIELFCREAQAPIVAITGSNGKSTVTSLVGEMAKAAGMNVGVGGNIGLPALMLLDPERELYGSGAFKLPAGNYLQPAGGGGDDPERHRRSYGPLSAGASAVPRRQTANLRECAGLYRQCRRCVNHAGTRRGRALHQLRR